MVNIMFRIRVKDRNMNMIMKERKKERKKNIKKNKIILG
jgi:hypothetical protein